MLPVAIFSSLQYKLFNNILDGKPSELKAVSDI